jgi:hypothetical protein
MNFDFPATIPANKSWCPPRYLVALCKIISEPYSAGLKFIGVAKVESIAVIIFFFFAKSIINFKSTILKKGLVGISEKNKTVFDLVYFLIFKISSIGI